MNNITELEISNVIKIFPKFNSSPQCFTVNEISKRTSIDIEQINNILKGTPNIFAWLTPHKITTIVSIIKSIRNKFELYKYSDLDIENECSQSLKKDFKVKVLNSRLFEVLFNIKDRKTFNYCDFAVIEKKYIKNYNIFAPQEYQIPDIVHLNIRNHVKEVDLVAEFSEMINASSRGFRLLKKKLSGQTLEEIAKQEHLSRERVRKIIEKPSFELKQWIISNEEIIAQKYADSSNLLKEDLLTDMFGKDNWILIKKKIEQIKESLIYLKPIDDMIFRDNGEIENILKAKRGYPLTEIIAILNEVGYTFITLQNIYEIYNLYKLDEQPIMKSTSLFNAVPDVVNYLYPSGIKINDKRALEEVIKVAKNKYKIEIESKDPIRSVSLKIQNNGILVDKGAYVMKDIFNVPPDLIDDIYKYIVSTSSKMISYDVLYDNFKEKLSNYNIFNKYALHGVLKFYNTYKNIQLKKDYIIVSSSDITNIAEKYKDIMEYLKEQGKPIKEKDILRKFPEYTSKNIYAATIYYSELTKWDADTYYNLSSIVLEKETKQKLFKEVENSLQNSYNYSSIYYVYSKIKNENPEILESLKINNHKQLYKLISFIFKDQFYFSDPHILTAKSDTQKAFETDDLIQMCAKSKEGETLNKKELMKEIQQVYGRNSSTIMLSVNKLLRNYCRITKNEYINCSKISISEKQEKQISDSIIKKMNNEELKINETTDLSFLPPINIKWTPFMLPDIINLCNLPFNVEGNNPTSATASYKIVKK